MRAHLPTDQYVKNKTLVRVQGSNRAEHHRNRQLGKVGADVWEKKQFGVEAL